PVLQVHVGVADQHIEREPPDALCDIGIPSLDTDHLGDAAVRGAAILLVGVDVEYLREVLDVEARTIGAPVESLDGEGGTLQCFDALRKVRYRTDLDEVDGRDVDADEACERHHRVFVLGHTRELPRWKL